MHRGAVLGGCLATLAAHADRQHHLRTALQVRARCATPQSCLPSRMLVSKARLHDVCMWSFLVLFAGRKAIHLMVKHLTPV